MNPSNSKFWLFLGLLLILNIAIFFTSPNKTFFTGEDFQWLNKVHVETLNLEEVLFYRPLLQFYFLTAFKKLELPYFYYHLINHFLHLIVCILVMIFIYKLTKNRLISFLCAAIFGLHYMNTNVVFTIRRIDEIMAVFFMLCCLILILNYIEKKNKACLIWAVFLTIIAFFARETSVVLPLLILILLLFYDQRILRKKLILSLPFFLIMSTFLIIRLVLCSNSLALENERLSVLIAENFLRLPLLSIGLKLLFIPFQFQGKGVEFLMMRHHDVFLMWLIVLGYFFLVYIIKDKHYRFSLLWIGITLLPALYYPDPIIREKYLYIPLIGVGFLWSLFFTDIGKVLKFKKALFCLLAAMFLILSFKSRIKRGRDFIEVSKTVKSMVDSLETIVISNPRTVVYVVNHPYNINQFAAFPGSCAYLFLYIKKTSRYDSWCQLPIFINIEFDSEKIIPLERIEEFVAYIKQPKNVEFSKKELKEIAFKGVAFFYPDDEIILGIDSRFPSFWRRYMFYFDSDKSRFIDVSLLVNNDS
ncbi:MAG: hypothetical protein P9X27_01060 [Candidatus Kaelpia aquatica]|nr:hypothetical protein [Candidatus Kaelpia aquatica]